MPGKFEKYYRIFVLLLIVVLFWSLWAQAQTTNTNSEPSVTNAAPTWVTGVEHWDERRLTFGLDRIPVLREWQLLGEPLWKYVASLIFIMIALAATKLLDQIAFVWLKKFAGRTATKIDDLLLDLLHGPIKVIAFVILLHIGLSIFDWSPKVKIWFSKSLILVVAISLTYLGLKTVDSFLEAWRRRVAHEADRKFNDQLFSILRKSLNIFIIIVAVLVTASNIGINITAAITSLSIGGLAIGLAAQDTLANLFGAIAVFADKPFRIGDQIKVPDAEGVVEEVGMRSTKVRSPEGHLIAVPNKAMANATIANFTKRTSIKTTMNFALARTLPAGKVKQALAILGEIYRGHKMTQDAWISFNQFTGANINIMVVHWWKGTETQKYLADMEQMNLAVKERFDAEGIQFA